MTTREDLSNLLDRAREYATYGQGSSIIMELVVALERTLEKPLDKTLDDVWKQNEDLCRKVEEVLDVANHNQAVLKSWGDELHRQIEEEAAEHAALEENVAPPKTGVYVHVFRANGDVIAVEDADVVHVVLENGTIPFAYEAEEDGERRKPGYYDDAGEFHAFDDRRASRRGW